MRLPLPVSTTLLFCLFVGGNEARHYYDGQAKLAAAALPGKAATYDVAITLDVTPEPFHMTRLQRWGTMTGAQNRVVTLRNVPADRLAEIAREPWVASLAPAGG